MSASEVIDQIKSLPREERLNIFRFLSQEFVITADAKFFDEFTLIGADTDQSDIKFAESAQGEVWRHG